MKNKVCFIALRGYSSKFHPNTEEAMEFCLARNVDYIGSDVFSGAEIAEDGLHVKV